MASATLSTTTIPVAAETPPIIVDQREPGALARSGQRQNGQIAVERRVRENVSPASASGATNRLIGDQIERETATPPRECRGRRVLDDRHMELARQQQRPRSPTGAWSTSQIAGSGALDDRGDPGIGRAPTAVRAPIPP